MSRNVDHDRAAARTRGERAAGADHASERLARADAQRDRRRRNPTVAEMFDDVVKLLRKESKR